MDERARRRRYQRQQTDLRRERPNDPAWLSAQAENERRSKAMVAGQRTAPRQPPASLDPPRNAADGPPE